MPSDPIRDRLRELLRRNDLTMKSASTAIGRNHAYLHQYLTHNNPRVLGYRDSEALAKILRCDPDELRHPTVPPRRAPKRKRRRPPIAAPLAGVAEVAVAAGPDYLELNEDVARETARWYLPEKMLRQEGGAQPDDLRIIAVRGDSMEPLLSEGDRLFIDTGQKLPATGELCALWDGNGLVAKRVQYVQGSDPLQLRLISANPDYAPHTCLAEEARIVGKVLWTFRRLN